MPNLAAKLSTSGAALIAAFAAGNAEAQTTYNWSGFYVGAHGGYGFGTSHATDAGHSKLKGWQGGLQAGYNWQFSGVVLGAEIDGTYSGIDGKADPFFQGKNTNTLRNAQNWSGTARLKVGLPLSGVPIVNNMLIYGTGGLAVSRWKSSLNSVGPFITDFTERDSRVHLGFVVGGGVELPLMPNLSLKLEYLRSDYGSKRYDFGDTLGTLKIDHEINTLRMGVNYRFSTW
ncbi:MAG: outer membrane beta-barrel protein [Rhodospirillales bacterium]